MNAIDMASVDLAIQFDPKDAIGNVVVESDPKSRGTLRRKIGAAGPVRVRLETSDDDTTGNAMADLSAVVVQTYLDDDTEGHAMTLRFPTAQDAADFRRKLLVTGALVATIAAGATAINAGVLAPSISAPQAAYTTTAISHGDELAGVRAQAAVNITPATHGDELAGVRAQPGPATHGDDLIGTRLQAAPATHGDDLIGARTQAAIPSETSAGLHGDELAGVRTPAAETSAALHGDEIIGTRTQAPASDKGSNSAPNDRRSGR